MSTKLTPGKLAGMKAVSDKRGVIAAAAMDQRGSLKKSLAKEKGVAELPDSALIEFKELVTEVLTKHASAILLNPDRRSRLLRGVLPPIFEPFSIRFPKRQARNQSNEILSCRWKLAFCGSELRQTGVRDFREE